MPRSRVAFVALLSLGAMATAEVARSQQLIRLGGEFAVNVHTPAQQVQPEVAMDSEGDFVVTWWSFGQDGDGFGVFARRFDAAGVGLGGEFQVNIHGSSAQRNVAAGMAADGEFVIAWASQVQDGDGYGIFARRFDSAGAGLGSEFQVNTYTAGSPVAPRRGHGR